MGPISTTRINYIYIIIKGDNGEEMLFIVLGKFRKKPRKEDTNASSKMVENLAKEGIVFKAMYWTLGRYDTIGIFEAPSEHIAMKAMLKFADVVDTETLTTVSRDEIIKTLD
jgi:uncharacterized protein with GYD domain